MAFSLFRRKQKQPDNILPPGWQFFSRPTNLERPGTIFRIARDGTRYIVDRLNPAVDTSREPGASKIESIETKMGVLARLLGVEPLSASANSGRAKYLEYEISEPVHESTTDGAIDAVLKPYLDRMEYRPGYHYFVIRDTRSATAMKFRLRDELLGEIGGQAALNMAVNVGIKVSSQSVGVSELTQAFPERLGVMFLPEEIAPVRQGLAKGEAELGRIPVRGVLDWVEPENG